MKHLKNIFDFVKSNKKDTTESTIKVGDEFIGMLKNEYKNKTIKITKEMLRDDEKLYYFMGLRKKNTKKLEKLKTKDYICNI